MNFSHLKSLKSGALASIIIPVLDQGSSVPEFKPRLLGNCAALVGQDTSLSKSYPHPGAIASHPSNSIPTSPLGHLFITLRWEHSREHVAVRWSGDKPLRVYRTHRTHIAGTVHKLVHTRKLLIQLYVVAETDNKSSTHDVTWKLELILSLLNEARVQTS